MRLVGLVAILAVGACGQTTKVFTFAHTSTPQGYQEITTAVRVIAGTPDMSIDANAKTLTAGGTAEEVSIAQWLFQNLDIAPQGTKLATLEYTVPGGADDAVRLIYLGSDASPQQLQEIINAVRTITDISRVYQTMSVSAISLRAAAAQVGGAVWLVNAFVAPQTGKQEYTLPPTANPRSDPGGAVRVFHLNQTKTRQGLQEIVNAVRTIVDVSKIYQYLAGPAIVVRGHPEQIAVSEWLIGKLDRAEPAQAGEEAFTASGAYPPDSNAVRLFYFPDAMTPKEMIDVVGKIRSIAGLVKIYPSYLERTMVLRGTSAQVAQAEALMKQN